MFKKVIIALAIAAMLPVVAAAQKFGVVDVNAIFTAMPESTAAQNQLNEASKKYEEEWKKIAEEVDKKNARISKSRCRHSRVNQRTSPSRSART
jgi:Skp family chaperone for outer membrane proteins